MKKKIAGWCASSTEFPDLGNLSMKRIENRGKKTLLTSYKAFQDEEHYWNTFMIRKQKFSKKHQKQ